MQRIRKKIFFDPRSNHCNTLTFMQPQTINFSMSHNPMQEITMCAALVMTGAAVLLHIFLALGVLRDGSSRENQRQGLIFFGTLGWAFVTLLSGLFGLAIYWLMHYSTLQPGIQPPLDRIAR